MSARPRPSRVVRYHERGGPEVLLFETVEVAPPAAGEVRVRFAAGGLNPVDAKIRSGRSRIVLTLPVDVGREFSGVVEAVGAGVDSVAIGDAVFGSIPQGAFADWVIAPASVIARVPEAVPLEVAAGLALAGQTAWDALDSQGLASGDTIVVSAAAGGVGGILSQLAVGRGIRVIGTAGPANHDWLRERGVEPVLYGDGLRERLATAAPDGITAVFDQAGAETIEAALALGVPPERINTIATDASAYGVRGVGRGAVHPPTLDALAALVAASALDVPIAASFPLSEVREAFAFLEAGHLRGKVVVTADADEDTAPTTAAGAPTR
ncbi:NADP-dependent oxidoreductase [Microcella alkalica]|uniref:NADPH:quinone reductase-like Zn-dependent oxidoreductase n=1 Tax=Microcella alkalica TaxID=355930 RepID=A0A839E4K2_9MICO|nr:NADP-dependent oxidoreductase [Microcella alkalica]MBA8847609.1 NADPH:quinone reductase-like Zn-dependent oxidoreductase [Microcella alkalica]